MRNLNKLEFNHISGGINCFGFNSGLGAASFLSIFIGGSIILFSGVNVRPCTERECACMGNNPADSLNCTKQMKDNTVCGPDDDPNNH